MTLAFCPMRVEVGNRAADGVFDLPYTVLDLGAWAVVYTPGAATGPNVTVLPDLDAPLPSSAKQQIASALGISVPMLGNAGTLREVIRALMGNLGDGRWGKAKPSMLGETRVWLGGIDIGEPL